MRRMFTLLAVFSLAVFLLAGCGTKDADDVVRDLEKVTGDLESYKSSAVLSLKTGNSPQEYDVEVWYQKPANYRIALTSKQRNITQIILRNDEGVFVLTPHLNKSFRFQSDWPEKHGQVYLYESLVKMILDDAGRQFAAEEDRYMFEVKADYANKTLSKQRIWLDYDLAPKRVEVMDSDYNVLVELEFTHFEKGVQFDDDAFTTERNMQTGILNSLPAMADNQPERSFGVIQPGYVPEGVKLQSVEKVDDQIVLKYRGSYNFNLIEQRPFEKAVDLMYGEPVDLGYAFGVIYGDEKKTLTWIYDHVEYLLSGDLPMSEMVEIARSVQGQIGK